METILIQLLHSMDPKLFIEMLFGVIVVMWLKSTKKKLDIIEDIIPTINAIKELLPRIEAILLKQAISEVELNHIRERLDKLERRIDEKNQ